MIVPGAAGGADDGSEELGGLDSPPEGPPVPGAGEVSPSAAALEQASAESKMHDERKRICSAKQAARHAQALDHAPAALASRGPRPTPAG